MPDTKVVHVITINSTILLNTGKIHPVSDLGGGDEEGRGNKKSVTTSISRDLNILYFDDFQFSYLQHNVCRTFPNKKIV